MCVWDQEPVYREVGGGGFVHNVAPARVLKTNTQEVCTVEMLYSSTLYAILKAFVNGLEKSARRNRYFVLLSAQR